MSITAEKFIEAVQRSLPILKKLPKDLKEVVSRMLTEKGGGIDRERLNIILSTWKIEPVNRHFFKYYFKEQIKTTDELLDGFHHFMRDALWHFGDIRRGFSVLSQLESIDNYIQKHQFDVEEFKTRLPWLLVDNIAPLDRGFLGYVSGQRTYSEHKVLSITETILKVIDDNKTEWNGFDVNTLKQKIAEKISHEDLEQSKKLLDINECNKIDLWSLAELNKNKVAVSKTLLKVEETIKKIEKLKMVGERNQLHYLRNIETIDVYVATSMRDDREYVEMAKFVEEVFQEQNIAKLNLRYFDPTLCYCESRVDKGVIECLLVRTAKVTVYCAQDGDTFGKDSELAATLCQGKPVIVYVPQDEQDKERGERLNSRAKTFKEFHPLGLQVGIQDGVARGVIVVRTPQDCSNILLQILTNKLDVAVHFEEHGIVMRERTTGSVVRSMTGWGELAHCFWSNFGISINPKSGLPE